MKMIFFWILIITLSLIVSISFFNDAFSYRGNELRESIERSNVVNNNGARTVVNLDLFNNPPPDSLIQELIVQVADSNLIASIQRLQDFWSRDVTSDSIDAASYWIYNQLQEFGYSDIELDSFQTTIDTVTLVLWNVVVTKEGYGDSSRVIVIGGHYDSAGYYMLYPAPGADDNASGVAGTLEIARILKDIPLYDTVKFILFTCEEWSIRGSRHYAYEIAEPQGMDIELMVNLDMIANLSDSVWDIKLHTDTLSVTNYSYAELVADLAWTYTPLEPIILDRGPTTDHQPFLNSGYNAIFLFEGDLSPYHHGPEDLLENLTIPYAREVTKLALATVVTMAQYQSEPSGIEDQYSDETELPGYFSLNQNYPNPFNPHTVISFDVPRDLGSAPHVNLAVYNLRGRRVKTLINSNLYSGSHKVVWDGRDSEGLNVPSGIYFYSLKAGDFTSTKKMTLIR